jgi:dTDP-4-amino-4,6-dideoxygalactose transaminase
MTAVATQEIPLVDLKAQYATIRDEVRRAIDDVLESMQLTIGPNVKAFDQEFASYIGTKHSIGVGSGTDALQLAIRACGVSGGDEVITVSHTFFATVEAILYANARPILVEVDEKTMLIDPAAVAAAITPRTKAIIPVHLYGRAVDLKPLRQIAQDRNITIIEDAAQAHGALLDDGKKAGTGGRVNCFSFYCSKNLGAYGEAGSITTNDDRLAEELRALREHGQSTRYYHPVVGYNARLDEIQAAILRIKLRLLDKWNARRRDLARMYDERLKGVAGVIAPEIPSDIRRHVFYTYTIRVPGGRRDDMRTYLGERGIGTQIHYPVPIHLQQSAEFLGYRKGDMPVTEKVASEVLSLPMFAELTDDQLERVAESVRSFMKGN